MNEVPNPTCQFFRFFYACLTEIAALGEYFEKAWIYFVFLFVKMGRLKLKIHLNSPYFKT